MTNQETNLPITFGLTVHKPGSHCSIAMWNSFFKPVTKAQAVKWLSYVNTWVESQVLMSQVEVNEVSAYMSTYGFTAKFKYTKSKTMVRLANFQEFITCVKTEFAIK